MAVAREEPSCVPRARGGDERALGGSKKVGQSSGTKYGKKSFSMSIYTATGF
jgi:hypothetical protein